MNNFEDKLQIVLEEQEIDVQEDIVNIARELLDQIDELQITLQNTQTQLAHIIEKLNGTLGMEIRKRQPKMHITISDGTCKCGYYSGDMYCKPDLTRGRWEIGGRFGRNFIRNNPHVTRLTGDVAPLAQSITDFFQKHYKSLGR